MRSSRLTPSLANWRPRQKKRRQRGSAAEDQELFGGFFPSPSCTRFLLCCRLFGQSARLRTQRDLIPLPLNGFQSDDQSVSEYVDGLGDPRQFRPVMRIE